VGNNSISRIGQINNNNINNFFIVDTSALQNQQVPVGVPTQLTAHALSQKSASQPQSPRSISQQ